MILVQKARTDKTKYLSFWTEGEIFFTEWWQKDSKHQIATKKCIGMNIGKANETTPAEQAILEMEAKITKKKKEGYVEGTSESTAVAKKISTTITNLDNLPESFCPDKPISKCSDKVKDAPSTYGQRKYDGHCILLVRGKKTAKIYSRRMEDRTEYLEDIPVLKKILDKLPENTFVLTEFAYTPEATGKEASRMISTIVRKDDKEEVMRRYKELAKTGKFECIPFDALWISGSFIGNTDYLERAQSLKTIGIKVPTIFPDWKAMWETAKAAGWEGFILRVPGEKSYIGYSMDGKAHKAGSYKAKFICETDVIVTECIMGKAGKHANFFSKFKVEQRDSDGNTIDRGYIGPGTTPHTELEELTRTWNGQPFVVEISYQEIEDSGKIKFGVIERFRPDKMPDECVADD